MRASQNLYPNFSKKSMKIRSHLQIPLARQRFRMFFIPNSDDSNEKAYVLKHKNQNSLIPYLLDSSGIRRKCVIPFPAYSFFYLNLE